MMVDSVVPPMGEGTRQAAIASREIASVITYSPAYTLVPTYACFNRCSYCNFRVEPGMDAGLALDEAERILRSLLSAAPPVVEILLLSGEVHPQSPQRSAWFERLVQLAELALSLGFLPHTNAGILTRSEMQQLKAVNVSMGLMLEQLTPTLLETVHRHAPSKFPAVRLQQLTWAGELQIPFTTGLLLGIGENAADRIESLHAIATLHQQFGHIQEVILQPYSPGERDLWSNPAFSPVQLVELVAIARDILPADVAIQIPPNLMQSPDILLACLEAGARDLGGLGPKDEVNPDYPHPDPHQLQALLAPSGWSLQPRLPIYPQFDDWLTLPLREAVQQWRSRLTPDGSLD